MQDILIIMLRGFCILQLVQNFFANMVIVVLEYMLTLQYCISRNIGELYIWWFAEKTLMVEF